MMDHKEMIMATLECFLETCPDIPEEEDILFEKKVEEKDRLRQEVWIGGKVYSVEIKKIGEEGK